MPYTCKACGRYQPGQSADGICPAPECANTRALAGAVRRDDDMRAIERAAIVAWLRRAQYGTVGGILAAAIEAGEHLKG